MNVNELKIGMTVWVTGYNVLRPHEMSVFCIGSDGRYIGVEYKDRLDIDQVNIDRVHLTRRDALEASVESLRRSVNDTVAVIEALEVELAKEPQ